MGRTRRWDRIGAMAVAATLVVATIVAGGAAADAEGARHHHRHRHLGARRVARDPNPSTRHRFVIERPLPRFDRGRLNEGVGGADGGTGTRGVATTPTFGTPGLAGPDFAGPGGPVRRVPIHDPRGDAPNDGFANVPIVPTINAPPDDCYYAPLNGPDHYGSCY